LPLAPYSDISFYLRKAGKYEQRQAAAENGEAICLLPLINYSSGALHSMPIANDDKQRRA